MRAPARPEPETSALRPERGGGGVFDLMAGGARGTALLHLRRALGQAGIVDASLDARRLLLHALAIGPTELAARPEIVLDDRERADLAALAGRRLAGEPVGRILEERHFWGLPFRVGPDTLEPRPDSETLVATALTLCADREAVRSVLDLGTGTGCLLIALLSECSHASGLGIDRSPGALATAQLNAVANGVADRASFAAADWAAPLRGSFDVIVSNPPYIASAAIDALPVEVRSHDPVLALDGGPDGLAAYRTILPQAARLLAPGGFLVAEIGQGQAEAVARIGHETGLVLRRRVPDLSGIVRALAFARDP